MAFDEKERAYLDAQFEKQYNRLNALCEQVRENTTNIVWLKWAVVTIIGALILSGIGAAVAVGG